MTLYFQASCLKTERLLPVWTASDSVENCRQKTATFSGRVSPFQRIYTSHCEAFTLVSNRGLRMKERPIFFNSQRVRAVLSGQQSQTRRIMKSQPVSLGHDNHEGCYGIDVLSNQLQGNRVIGMGNLSRHCPYGQPGDRLWVRETWRGPMIRQQDMIEYERSPSLFKSAKYCEYRADTRQFSMNDNEHEHFGWQAGIHMPRWASRINLEINDIRLERIQEISNDDVAAEGVQSDIHFLNDFFAMRSKVPCSKDAYRKHWAQQYGGTSWEVNPWVWVIEFTRV